MLERRIVRFGGRNVENKAKQSVLCLLDTVRRSFLRVMSADDKEGIALKGLEGGAAFFIMKLVSQHDLKDLWQFASMKKRSNKNVSIEETPQENTSKGKNVVEEEIAPISAASATNKKESKKKTPRKEGYEEKN